MAEENNIPYEEFGKRLTMLRKKAGLTRAQLGKICGVAQSTIVNYEHGTRIPYADTAVKMADFFNISIHDLLGVKNPEIEMQQAEALDNMRALNGKKGEDRLRAVYKEAANLAGGDLTDDQLLEFSLEMTKMAQLAQQRLTERYSNQKYNKSVSRKNSETENSVRRIDEIVEDISSKKASPSDAPRF